jgi:hypothetical protein
MLSKVPHPHSRVQTLRSSQGRKKSFSERKAIREANRAKKIDYIMRALEHDPSHQRALQRDSLYRQIGKLETKSREIEERLFKTSNVDKQKQWHDQFKSNCDSISLKSKEIDRLSGRETSPTHYVCDGFDNVPTVPTLLPSPTIWTQPSPLPFRSRSAP